MATKEDYAALEARCAELETRIKKLHTWIGNRYDKLTTANIRPIEPGTFAARAAAARSEAMRTGKSVRI